MKKDKDMKNFCRLVIKAQETGVVEKEKKKEIHLLQQNLQLQKKILQLRSDCKHLTD